MGASHVSSQVQAAVLRGARIEIAFTASEPSREERVVVRRRGPGEHLVGHSTLEDLAHGSASIVALLLIVGRFSSFCSDAP